MNNFNTLKTNLITTLQNSGLTDTFINEIISDEFVSGLLEFDRTSEYTSLTTFIQNFSNNQNLNTILEFEKIIRTVLSGDIYASNVFFYIKDYWKEIIFPDENTRNIKSKIMRITAIISSTLTTIVNSPITKAVLEISDIFDWWDMAKRVDEQQKKYYDIVDRMTAELEGRTQNLFDVAQSTRSPLVLDIDGDGVETIGTNNGIYFDHDNNGFAENTGWAGADDGLLVRDTNNNGSIDNGTELFGNNTILSSGQNAQNGFDALADLDSNKDGVFNSSDTAWNEVKVWKDSNSDATVNEGELIT